jgi:hypothetical protein
MERQFPLAEDARFGVVHHRALNGRETLESALPAVAELPGYVHIAEGDLCWSGATGETILYFHHPDYLVDTRKPGDVERAREEGSLWTLEDALDEKFEDLLFVVEIKMGSGDRAAAIRKAVQLLERKRPGRYWIDTFSLRDARMVKAASPRAAVSLHVKVCTGGWLLKTALEFPPVSLRRPANLRDVDVVTLTYKTSLQRLAPWTGVALPKTADLLAASGKYLLLGGVASRRMFGEVKGSGARAGYIKFPWRELLTETP